MLLLSVLPRSCWPHALCMSVCALQLYPHSTSLRTPSLPPQQLRSSEDAHLIKCKCRPTEPDDGAATAAHPLLSVCRLKQLCLSRLLPPSTLPLALSDPHPATPRALFQPLSSCWCLLIAVRFDAEGAGTLHLAPRKCGSLKSRAGWGKSVGVTCHASARVPAISDELMPRDVPPRWP